MPVKLSVRNVKIRSDFKIISKHEIGQICFFAGYQKFNLFILPDIRLSIGNIIPYDPC